MHTLRTRERAVQFPTGCFQKFVDDQHDRDYSDNYAAAADDDDDDDDPGVMMMDARYDNPRPDDRDVDDDGDNGDNDPDDDVMKLIMGQ